MKMVEAADKSKAFRTYFWQLEDSLRPHLAQLAKGERLKVSDRDVRQMLGALVERATSQQGLVEGQITAADLRLIKKALDKYHHFSFRT